MSIRPGDRSRNWGRGGAPRPHDWVEPRPNPSNLARGQRSRGNPTTRATKNSPQLPSGNSPASDHPNYTWAVPGAQTSTVLARGSQGSESLPPSYPTTDSTPQTDTGSQRPRLEDSEFYSKPYCTDLGVQGGPARLGTPLAPCRGASSPPSSYPIVKLFSNPRPPSLLPLVRPAPAPNPRTFLLPEVCG